MGVPMHSPQHNLSPIDSPGVGENAGPRSVSLSEDDECAGEADDDDDIRGWQQQPPALPPQRFMEPLCSVGLAKCGKSTPGRAGRSSEVAAV